MSNSDVESYVNEFSYYRERGDSPAINVPLIRKTLSQIHDDPEHWDQSKWWVIVPPLSLVQQQDIQTCESYGCFAGWAVQLSGLDVKETTWGDYYTTEDNIAIDDKAAELLGINGHEAAHLFHADNTYQNIHDMCEALATIAGDTL